MRLTVLVLFVLFAFLLIMVHSELALPTIKGKEKNRKVKSSSELQSATNSSPHISSLFKCGTNKASSNGVQRVLLPPASIAQQSSKNLKEESEVEMMCCQRMESATSNHKKTNKKYESTLPDIYSSNSSLHENPAKFILHGTRIKNGSDKNMTKAVEKTNGSKDNAHITDLDKQNESELLINTSQFHLKFPTNVHRLQTGSDCCSIINLHMPLPCINNNIPGSNNTNITHPKDQNEMRHHLGISQKPYTSKSELNAKYDGWEKKTRERKIKFVNSNSSDRLTSALIKLRKVASSFPCNALTKESNVLSTNLSGGQLNIVNFEKQAASLPDPKFTNPRTLARNVNNPAESSSTSTESSTSEISHSPTVCHRVSLLSSLDEKKSKGNNCNNTKNYLIPAKHLLLEDKETGVINCNEIHTSRQLPFSRFPISNHLFSRRLSAGGTPSSDTPLHHSYQSDLSIEGNNNKKHKKEKPKLATRKGQLKDTYLPPLGKNASLQITSAKIHQSTPRLSTVISVHSPKRPCTTIKQTQSNGSINGSSSPDKNSDYIEYSYPDPFSGASNQFQWKLNKLHDCESITKRKEMKQIKK